jgi:anti-anti-sigma factor
LEIRDEERRIVISVSGELDLATSPALAGELERASASDASVIVLDLRGVSFMDSTGLSVLVEGQRRADESPPRFVVVKGGDQVSRLLALTGVADRLTLVDAPEQVSDADVP